MRSSVFRLVLDEPRPGLFGRFFRGNPTWRNLNGNAVLERSTLTLNYQLNQNSVVRSLARTDQGLVAILGNAVVKLGETSPTTTVLGASPALPADLDGYTLVPRTSLRLWNKGGYGKLGGYQYYPQLNTWEAVQCLQNL